MNTTSKNTLIGIIVVVIIAILGYLAWQERGVTMTPATTATSTSSTATSTPIVISSTSTTQDGGYTITPITGPAAPSYKTPLTFAPGFDATEKSQDQTQFASIQTTLAASPSDYNSWLDLGALRENTGDYTGAAADWKYVTELYPTDPTAFANLGDLYANYIHQSATAITYYKDAIKIDPTKEETFYDNLAQVYLNEGDKADAKATLQQGINAQVVGYQNLQNELNAMQ